MRAPERGALCFTGSMQALVIAVFVILGLATLYMLATYVPPS